MKISSLLKEAPGTPALSLDQDLMQRAMLKFPGYDKQQALSLYIADKASQQEKIDASQNNLINTQRSAIQTLQGELDANEDEVERIKQLTAKVTAGGADTRQKAKVSGEELEKLQKQLEELKDKPNLDPKQYKEMEAQIMALASNPSAENTDVRKLRGLVNQIDSKATVNYDAVYKQLQATQQELDSKEQRFQKSINKNTDKFEKNASEFRRYADIVDGYKNKIDKFDDFMNAEKENILNLRGEIQQKAQDIEDMSAELASTIGFVKPLLRKSAAAASQGGAPRVAPGGSQNSTGRKLPDQGIEPANDRQYDLFANGTNESKIFELSNNRPIEPVLDHDAETEDWLKKYLPVMVNDFKNMFARALANKSPTYNDHQIAYAIESNVEDLFQLGENPISRQSMNGFLSTVKTELFQQPPETSTVHMKKQDKLFYEGLDRIINLSSIKRVKKS
jgi:hypothetical protein